MQSCYLFSKKRFGFSMIELVTVLAVLLVLSVFALPTVELSFVRSREKLLHERLTEIRRAIDKYSASIDINKGPVFPASVASLTGQIRADFLLPGANAGPFLASESLGNPFSEKGDSFIWDVRDTAGVWHQDQQNPFTQLGVFDVRYPLNGIAGWNQSLDGTLYALW